MSSFPLIPALEPSIPSHRIFILLSLPIPFHLTLSSLLSSSSLGPLSPSVLSAHLTQQGSLWKNTQEMRWPWLLFTLYSVLVEFLLSQTYNKKSFKM